MIINTNSTYNTNINTTNSNDTTVKFESLLFISALSLHKVIAIFK